MAAAVLCFCLAAATAFRLPVFFGADERPHFAYAVRVLQGDLPEINDKNPSSDERFPVLAESLGYDEVPEVDRGRTIHVANHPPLFYVLAAGPLWLAGESEPDSVAPLTLRLLNAAFMAVGVWLTGLLAMELFAGSPRRHLLGVVAAGVTAVTPNLVGVAAYGHNDGLGFMLATGGLLLAVRFLRAGPSPGSLLMAATLGAGCALTRASLLPVVLLLAFAGAVGAWRHSSPTRRGVTTAGAVAALLGVPALAGSWFYLRNLDLYGSLTGDSVNLERLERLSHERSNWEVLTADWFHENMWTGLYGIVHPALRFAHRDTLLLVLLAITVVGLLARCVRARAARDVVGLGVVGAVGLAGYVIAIMVGVADHVSQGGGMHPRYYLPFVALVGAAVARAVDALPGRRVVALVVIGGLAWVCVGLLLRYPSLIDRREDADRVWVPGAAASPVLIWLAAIVAAVAFVRVVLAVLDPDHAARAQHPVEKPPTDEDDDDVVTALQRLGSEPTPAPVAVAAESYS